MATWIRARYLLAALITLAALLLAVYTADRLLREPAQQVADLIRPDADLAMQTIHYTETRNGERVWSLKADSAVHDMETGQARVEALQMTIFDRKNGDIGITADRGELDLQQRRVRLVGHVVVTTATGQKLHADDLVFTDADRTVRTAGPVTMVAADFRVAGIGLNYEIDSRRLQLLKQVDAQFNGRMTVP